MVSLIKVKKCHKEKYAADWHSIRLGWLAMGKKTVGLIFADLIWHLE
jgi:hypothetical protein